MRNGRAISVALLAAAAAISSPAAAETPRELLVSAAFAARDKASALARIEAAIKGAQAIIARDAGNREALLQRSIALGYRAKLNRSPADAKAARRGFEALVASNPGDAEAQLGLAGWHLLAIVEMGPLLARTMLGARQAPGRQALDRALAAGGGRALIPAYAGMSLIQLEPGGVAEARRLVEAAAKARAPTPIDQIMQRHAAALLVPLRAGDGKAAAALAEKLMPFGRLAK
ncbi:MAG TPA: hypothetical protein VGD19_03495 [Allosphingosinicella sp.]